MVYLEQMHINLLDLVDNNYWQKYGELILLSVISRCGTFHHFYLQLLYFSAS